MEWFLYDRDLRHESVNYVAGGGSRGFEKEGAVCRSPWLADEETFKFQMIL